MYKSAEVIIAKYAKTGDDEVNGKLAELSDLLDNKRAVVIEHINEDGFGELEGVAYDPSNPDSESECEAKLRPIKEISDICSQITDTAISKRAGQLLNEVKRKEQQIERLLREKNTVGIVDEINSFIRNELKKISKPGVSEDDALLAFKEFQVLMDKYGAIEQGKVPILLKNVDTQLKRTRLAQTAKRNIQKHLFKITKDVDNFINVIGMKRLIKLHYDFTESPSGDAGFANIKKIMDTICDGDVRKLDALIDTFEDAAKRRNML